MSSHRGPVGLDALGDFNDLIDARSPAEFAEDHLPGARNFPVLNDEERAIVGTIYKQQGAFEARRIGAGLVAANLARHWENSFSKQPEGWKPLVYCWRGGLRSGSMVTWMRLTGWDAQQLRGGYKGFRRQVVADLPGLVEGLKLVVLCGQTGTAKTRLLQRLAEQGEQVLDLESLARHKGSMLGAWPDAPQPSQKHFETLLHAELQRIDHSRPVFVESESAKIGAVAVPIPLVQHLRQSSLLIEIDADPAARLEFLLRDYAYLGNDPEAFATLLGRFARLQSRETVSRWQEWARAADLRPLFAELMSHHYDPQYRRSLGRNFPHWSRRHAMLVDDLSEAGITRLATEIRQFIGKAAA
ncbi:MAG: tRNA 2-selenouridine(34) synthase MnmH [Lautropia sp.]|nr:tRNA 2-selenouridine(34) synthase MnmH [Lautropia sp.]